jgi:hypothetical protein
MKVFSTPSREDRQDSQSYLIGVMAGLVPAIYLRMRIWYIKQ